MQKLNQTEIFVISGGNIRSLLCLGAVIGTGISAPMIAKKLGIDPNSNLYSLIVSTTIATTTFLGSACVGGLSLRNNFNRAIQTNGKILQANSKILQTNDALLKNLSIACKIRDYNEEERF